MAEPILLVADKTKNIFDMPGYVACAQAGQEVRLLSADDLIPLPPGINMFFLPDRSPVAFNMATQTIEALAGHDAVAAFVPPGYTQLYTAAYMERPGAKMLPLFSYAPVVFYRGAFYVAAMRIDRRKKHDITGVDKKLLARKVNAFRNTSNRLIRHLACCAQTNYCPNAINFFLGKFEAPLPASPVCNARCLGCISFQPKGSCKSTQDRLDFSPTAQEIAEIALQHIKTASEPIVSFGQGCEGEPLMAAKTIKEAITIIRRRTPRGTIHMNTNASLPRQLDSLFSVGLDSIRVSLNSAQEEFYTRYYSPRGYTLADVHQSMAVAKKHGKFVALNYLVMPGFTDRADEFKAFRALVREYKVDMIQWRNLNYDPHLYFKCMKLGSTGKLLGIATLVERLKKDFPGLRHGYFNVPKERM